MFRKKKPSRLYYPSKSRWFNKPRRKSTIKRARRGGRKKLAKFFKELVKKSFYLIVVTVIFIIVMIVLALSSYFAVSDIEVVRESFNIDSAAIENQLKPFIGKNFLFFPRSEVRSVIQEHFPEFSNIDVHKVFPSTIRINLESHPVVANLRAYYLLPKVEEVFEESFIALNRAIEEFNPDSAAISLSDTPTPLENENIVADIFDLSAKDQGRKPVEQKSLLNRIGQAVFDQEENLELITVTLRGLTQPVEDREMVIPVEHMDYMLDAIQHFENLIELRVTGIEYWPVAREIHLKMDNQMVLWLNLERRFKDQIDKLNTIYKAAELNKENLAYIDLRIRNKVIYCLRNTRCDR